MSKAARIADSALALTREERAALAAQLIRSLDTEADADADAEAAWAEVVARRIEDIDEGRVEPVSAEESLRRARARVAGVRSDAD